MLIEEGLGYAAAHRLASALAVDGAVAHRPANRGRTLPRGAERVARQYADCARKGGLVRADGELFVLADDFPLPATGYFTGYRRELPAPVRELLLAAHSSALMEALAAGESEIAPITGSMIEAFENPFGLGCRGGKTPCRTLAPLRHPGRATEPYVSCRLAMGLCRGTRQLWQMRTADG